MDIKEHDGTYYFFGRMDEYTDFDILLSAAEPLKINIGKVASINSIGVRKFLAFTLQWSPRRMEFYECTPDFIANINVIPQLLGKSQDPSQIKSYFVPYYCENRKAVENHLFDASDIVISQTGDIILPARKCAQCTCESGMDLDVEKEEYFHFLLD